MNRIQRSAINMLASLIGYAIPMLLTVAITPLLLREVGQAAYGVQSLVAVIIGYFTVMDMGLDLPITKYLAEDRARGDMVGANRMLNTAIHIYGVVGLVGLVGAMLSGKWLALNAFRVPPELVPEAIVVFRLAGLGFLASVGMSWGRAVTMGLQRFDVTYGVSVAANVAGIGLGLGFVFAGEGIVGYVLMRTLASMAAGFSYWRLAHRLLPTYKLKWGIDRASLRRIRDYLGYGAVNRVVGGIAGRLDQTFVAMWLGVAAAGAYAIPFMVVTSLVYMIAYMLGFLFPTASELHARGEADSLRMSFVRATRFISALGMMAFIPLVVFGDRLLTVWVGASIAGQASSVFRLMAVSGLVSTMTVSVTNHVAVGIGRIRAFTIYNVARGLMLGFACLVLVQPFGLEGAGFALLASNIVDAVYLLAVIGRYLKISPGTLVLQSYATPSSVGLLLGAISLLLRPISGTWLGLTAAVGLFELMYVLLGVRTRVFGSAERQAILGLWQMAWQRVRPAA